jgi:hypothetical protein
MRGRHVLALQRRKRNQKPPIDMVTVRMPRPMKDELDALTISKGISLNAFCLAAIRDAMEISTVNADLASERDDI